MVNSKTIPEGYKLTDVGVIPKDWSVRSFGEIFTFLSTGSNSRSDLSQSGDIKYIHYGDIHTKWRNILDCKKDTLPYISSEKVKNLPFIEEGDLVLADASEDYENIGISVEVINVGDDRIVAGLHTILLRGDKDIVTDGFKGYLHSINTVKSSLRRISTGISVYGISKKNLADVLIPLPTLPEQKEIAKHLSDIKTLIETLEELLEKKNNIKQGIMQELLSGKKRLKGFTKDWEDGILGDYVTIRSGESPSKFKFNNNGIPYYKVEQLNNSGKYQVETPYFIECNNAIPKGSIIFPKRGASILLNKVRILSKDSYMDTNLMTLTTNKELNNEFLYYFIKFIELWRIADTTSIPQINNKHILPLKIKVPPLLEQVKIAQILSDMDSEIIFLKKRLEKYKAVEAGVMHDLLNGKVRLV
ncbi:restriction endonuclease subunit S [Anaerobacillus isosaccharinicus]|uniref:Restriction endonuclease subunit S n=1 Tax=Anaerobacillus isosaccharinicus TaxID=1532552 RepID=A0A1S2L1N4_9BACI|nr:restriction endonuclease subunit S [Anaerobacillus isosaccharinicus]MBA5584260.1 restriction endonuclease subunit S [Anaerobacillus isosaccharinicus]QOY37339.1 restriction endonuclease subunit S [Anaerobacillus isosaccharinicus]